MSENITKYNLEYKGVLCTGVQWGYGKFFFTKDGKEYEFDQTKYIQCVADTDYIRCVIEENFLPWVKDERIKELKAENAALRERLEKAVELPPGDRVWYIAEDEEGQESYIILKPTISLTVEELKYEMDKKYFTTREAAETRLAELNGGKQ